VATGVTGVGNPLVEEAEILATLNGGTPAIFTIPAGTEFFNDRGIAGDIRVGFNYGNEGSFANLSDNGRVIFGRLIDSLATQAVPEPATTTLALLGLAGLGLRRRRRVA